MKPSYICIHHTAVSYTKNEDQWKATERYHISKGWGGGGYNYEVAADGGIHQFREDGTPTAAQYQKNMNDGRCISICLDGNFDIELPTAAQIEAVRELLEEKMKEYAIPKENVLKHRDLAFYKSCPGKLIPDDVYSYFMKKEVPKWAEDAWSWALSQKLINENSEPTEEFIRMLVVLHRYDLSKGF